MKRQPARVLAPIDVDRLLQLAERRRYPLRNRTMVLLSFKAGLRACEIAGLTWPMVLRTDGRVADHISISGGIAKYGSARRIPVHRDLRTALKRYNLACDRAVSGAVIRSERDGAFTAKGVVNWFHHAYRDLRLEGCSSHSGRRTFITQTARVITKVGGSLRDVQELAGHRALTTTERYIVGDREAQRRLISLI